MGIMPLQFLSEQNADSLELSGKEKFTITMPESLCPRQQLTVKVWNSSSSQRTLSYSFRSDVTPVSCVLADQWRKVLPCHGHVRQRDRRYHLPTRRPPQICRSDFPLKMTPPRGPLLPAVVETNEQQPPPPVYLQHGWEKKKKIPTWTFEPDVPEEVSDIWTASSSPSPFQTEMMRALAREHLCVEDAAFIPQNPRQDEMNSVGFCSFNKKTVLPRKAYTVLGTKTRWVFFLVQHVFFFLTPKKKKCDFVNCKYLQNWCLSPTFLIAAKQFVN